MMRAPYENIALHALMQGQLEPLFCCIGDPVIGNPTQTMMEASLRHDSLPGRYLTMTVTKDNLKQAVAGLKALGFSGANVTAPHKVAVIEYLDELTESARLTQAVNCISFRDGKLVGDNTDGKGFTESIAKLTTLAGLRVLVFGAGGAARAIVTELARHKAASVAVVNRDPKKAQAIVTALQSHVHTTLTALKFEHPFIIRDGYDLVVQATSVGLFDPNGALDLVWETGTHPIAADVVFNPIQTVFLQTAQAAGAHPVDGLGMLVHQGALALSDWTGRPANLPAMRQALENAFGMARKE